MAELTWQSEYGLASRRRVAACIALALAFAANMLGSTLPAPLYPIYQDQLGFSSLTVTVIFAIYAAGVIAALVVTGRWSDELGRRPILAAGLLASALSACCFLWGGSLPPLLVGRLLSGLSVGLITGTATVAITELAPEDWSERSKLIATLANMGGLGLGPLLAGVLAQYLPWPLHLCFALDLVLLVLAAIAVYCIPETVSRSARPRLTMEKPHLPAGVRAVFVPAAIANFAGFLVTGLFTSVAPAVVGDLLHYRNHALIGSVIFLVFVGSSAGQFGQDYLRESRKLPVACIALMIGMALVGVAVVAASLTVLIAGALIAGMGQGMAFRAGMGAVVAASPAAHRGGVAALFFINVYIAISIPVVGLGLTIGSFGLLAAGLSFIAAVVVLAFIALIALWVRRRRIAT